MSQTVYFGIWIISDHLKNICKVKKLNKWVPHELSESQRVRRFEVCLMLSQRNLYHLFLYQIVTYDAKWLLYGNHKRSAWLWRSIKTLSKTKLSFTVDYGHCLVIYYSGCSLRKLTVSNWIKCMFSWAKSDCRGQILIDAVKFCFLTLLGHMLLTMILEKRIDLEYEIFPDLPYFLDKSTITFFFSSIWSLLYVKKHSVPKGK